MITTFKLTEDHLKLIQRMYVGWSYVEHGAPEIDPKRPYGNSWVVGDIHEILKGDDYDDFEMPEDLEVKYEKLHKETEIALQIVLATQSFTPGVYKKSNPYNSRDWKLAE